MSEVKIRCLPIADEYRATLRQALAETLGQEGQELLEGRSVELAVGPEIATRAAEVLAEHFRKREVVTVLRGDVLLIGQPLDFDDPESEIGYTH